VPREACTSGNILDHPVLAVLVIIQLLSVPSLELTTFISNVPEYVILSHNWEQKELIFENVVKNPISAASSSARAKRRFFRVQGTRAFAAKDEFEWVWVARCCINKSSPAGLQEAIHSTFRWCQNIQIYYPYLSDIPNEVAGLSGWILQALLAP
jgi:hypothetical protein